MISRHSYLENDEPMLIAVYDSLRDDMSFNNKLETSYRVGDFISLPNFCLMDTGINEPILLNNFNMSVVMEVYEVKKKILNELDYYYGFFSSNLLHNDLNRNNRIEINTPYGRAYTYINNQPINQGRVIPFGDWKDYLHYSSKMNIKKHEFKKTLK